MPVSLVHFTSKLIIQTVHGYLRFPVVPTRAGAGLVPMA